MKKQPVIFDCDGVLLDWESGFRLWAEAEYHSAFSSEFPLDWNLSNWIGCSSEQAKIMIHEFNHSDAFGRLLPMPHAARTLYEVDRAGHPIYVLTSCSSDKEVQAQRRKNLAAIFNTEIQRTICLDLGVSKKFSLDGFKEIMGECIWVEDNFGNAIAGADAGHRSCFLHRPHNQTYWGSEPQRLKHLDCLSDLVSLIK